MTCSGCVSCVGGGAPTTPRGVYGERIIGAAGASALCNGLAKMPLIFLVCGILFLIARHSWLFYFNVLFSDALFGGSGWL